MDRMAKAKSEYYNNNIIIYRNARRQETLRSAFKLRRARDERRNVERSMMISKKRGIFAFMPNPSGDNDCRGTVIA
jgi:hypothetical protein